MEISVLVTDNIRTSIIVLGCPQGLAMRGKTKGVNRNIIIYYNTIVL